MSGTHTATRETFGQNVKDALDDRLVRFKSVSESLGERAATLCERGAVRLEASLMTLATTRATRNRMVAQRALKGNEYLHSSIADSLIRHGHADDPGPLSNYIHY